MGIPIVSTRFAAEGLEVEDGKNILLADTSEQFVKKIEMLLKDDQLYRELSFQGRKLAETTYEWSKIGADLSELYESVLNR